MRLPAHWSWRYFRRRLAERIYRIAHPGRPWICVPAVEVLEARLSPDCNAWEWGAGRSTPWLARRCARLVSIEDQPAWQERVQGHLERTGFTHAECRLIPDPEAYVRAIDSEPGGSLGLILIDGPSALRAACFLRALPKVSPGGWIVLDDAQRHMPSDSESPEAIGPAPAAVDPAMADVLQRVASWKCLWLTDGVKDTAFFQKPSGRAGESHA